MKFPFQALTLSLAASFAFAGGAHAQIVNIKGYGSDGAGANIYGYPVQPGTQVSLFNPVMLKLDAGDYLISDAWGLEGATYDAWNFQADVAGSWAVHFVVAAKGSEGSFTLLLDAGEAGDPACTYHYCAWLTEKQASDQFLATAPFKLHLDSSTDLAFASGDYALGDNLGGMSLLVTKVSAVPAVPEPQTYALMLGGLLGMGAWARRRQGATPR